MQFRCMELPYGVAAAHMCVFERTICLHCLVRSCVYNILFHFHHFQFRSCYLHNTHPSYMHHECEVFFFAHLVNALFICNRNHNSLVIHFVHMLPMVCSMNNFHIWLVFTEFGRSNVLQRFWWGYIYYQKSRNELWRSFFLPNKSEVQMLLDKIRA